MPSLSSAEAAAKGLEDSVEHQHRDLVNQAKKARQLASSDAYALGPPERAELNRRADKLD
jgi:hypothetical protein